PEQAVEPGGTPERRSPRSADYGQRTNPLCPAPWCCSTSRIPCRPDHAAEKGVKRRPAKSALSTGRNLASQDEGGIEFPSKSSSLQTHSGENLIRDLGGSFTYSDVGRCLQECLKHFRRRACTARGEIGFTRLLSSSGQS